MKSNSKQKIKTKWNLGLMYSSPSDPKIMRNVKNSVHAYEIFEKKYQNNRSYLTKSGDLVKALTLYEKLQELANPLIYLHLLNDIESANSKAEALRNKISQIFTQADNKIIFFRLSLGSIPSAKQKQFLADAKLKKYHYFLKQIFVRSKYKLSEAEEKILNLKSLPGYGLWVTGQEKLLAGETIFYGGKQVSLGEAMNKVRVQKNQKERQKLHNIIMNRLKSVSAFAESEINAIVIDKKIDDELRGYKKSSSATIIGYQNSEKEIDALTTSVTKHFPIAHRFYKLKAKMLKLKKLYYSDRAAVIGIANKKVPFMEGLNFVKKAFSSLGREYLSILDSYLEKGQIDVFPMKGKKSGAYCWSNVNTPTYVLLNYTDSLDSVSTFAHEMGHAIHGEFSKTQPVIYQGHTISVAEVASTLFENFAFEEVFKTLSEKEKIIALHDRIADDVQTIFRQIALFNFELELHDRIRKEGALSKENIALLMNKHMKSYLGSVFELSTDDGYFFVTWSHIRRFFYVYSYAYGQLISKALYKKYQKDKSYLKKIEQFLKAGESMSPADIFKSIGIHTSKPSFFTEGLKSIETDIIRLEKLIKKY